MRTRITVTDLRAAVDLLNRTTDATPGAIGSYILDGAYGGWQLQRLATDGGGIRQITYGYIPARELLERISAYRHGYERAEYDRGCVDPAWDTIYRAASVRPEPDACPVTGDTYGLPA
jgi:hypothetical protein